MQERSPQVRHTILSFTGEQITVHGCPAFAKSDSTGSCTVGQCRIQYWEQIPKEI